MGYVIGFILGALLGFALSVLFDKKLHKAISFVSADLQVVLSHVRSISARLRAVETAAKTAVK